MTELTPVPDYDWATIIKVLATASKKQNDEKIRRDLAFNAVQALLRGGIFTDDDPIGMLHKETLNKLKNTDDLPNAINVFLNTIRSANLKSIGIHIVDPLEGRISTIWLNPTLKGDCQDKQLLAKSELYSNTWNRIYRRLFRPSATLINAFESGVFPPKWDTVTLPEPEGVANSSSLAVFFKDTAELASELFDCIKYEGFLPTNPDATKTNHIEAVFQKTWNELENSGFIMRLKRIAVRYRDSILDDDNNKREFINYLKGRNRSEEVPAVIESATPHNPGNWFLLLDAIEGIQSSILSQPEFCDKKGLWLHRISFKSPPLKNSTRIYFIFGLTQESNIEDNILAYITQTFNNLATALNNLLDIPNPEYVKPSEMVSDLYEKILKHNKFDYHMGGLARWLDAVEKIARDAKHEGYPIKYNIGYGSLAYAQTHLHRYETAPEQLSKQDVPPEKIANYIKGFYSIFGNRDDRGLWFDECGKYSGVYENRGRDFETSVSDYAHQSQDQNTVLFAKIKGVGLFEILNRDGNQITRVKDGVVIDMEEGDTKRKVAIKTLIDNFTSVYKSRFNEEFVSVTCWLVNELIEVLQIETHGTSFVISFNSNGSDLVLPNASRNKSWRSSIEEQVKRLVGGFSHLSVPVATWSQLQSQAAAWERQDGKYTRQKHPFKFLAELANLDGGLWLRLSDKGDENGLTVRAAQQFIPLLKINKKVRPFDLHLKPEILDLNPNPQEKRKTLSWEDLPKSITEPINDQVKLKAFLSAINGHLPEKIASDKTHNEQKKYIDGLSFLLHSGTKTHSLWGLSLTARELCLCCVLSMDGKTYIFHDGREFIGSLK